VGHGQIIPRGTMITALAGLWYFSGLFSYLAVKFVHGFDGIWRLAKRIARWRITSNKPAAADAPEVVPDPSRRYFFKTATAVAGATPFLSAVYGFAAERLNYQIRHVQVPVAHLPTVFDGKGNAQVSDIHLRG